MVTVSKANGIKQDSTVKSVKADGIKQNSTVKSIKEPAKKACHK